MIYEALDGLKTHLGNTCHATVEISPKETSPEQYTLIALEPIGTGEVARQNDQTVFLIMPLQVRIIDSRDNEMKVLRALDAFLQNIGTYRSYMGHDITGDIDFEYPEDSTYQVRLQLKLKFDNHKEN